MNEQQYLTLDDLDIEWDRLSTAYGMAVERVETGAQIRERLQTMAGQYLQWWIRLDRSAMESAPEDDPYLAEIAAELYRIGHTLEKWLADNQGAWLVSQKNLSGQGWTYTLLKGLWEFHLTYATREAHDLMLMAVFG